MEQGGSLFGSEGVATEAVDLAAAALLLRAAGHPTAASDDARHLQLAWRDTRPRMLEAGDDLFAHWVAAVKLLGANETPTVLERALVEVEVVTAGRRSGSGASAAK